MSSSAPTNVPPAPTASPPRAPDEYIADLEAIARIGAVKKILQVVCQTTGLGFSAVARVTEKHWIACAVLDQISFGLEAGGELEIASTICDEIRQSGQLVVIDDVASDPNFCNHHTPRRYGFRSYISVPVTLPDGRFFGTLCAIDPRPARVNTPQIIGMFQLFADLIAMHLASQERMQATQADLLSERTSAQLRDQFIAVLGHDLRNPLNAIQTGVQLLELLPHDKDAGETLEMMQRSVGRMAGLIGNVLDFARGRLGGGMPVTRVVTSNLQATLAQVVGELQSAWPKRRIDCDIAVAEPIACDPPRIGQMLSNLLGNALTHGDADGPVHVRAGCGGGTFELSVTNGGPAIPEHMLKNLFQPFTRGAAHPGQQGLGLGLYIAAEIARAHGGTLTVASRDGQTCFTLRMPALS